MRRLPLVLLASLLLLAACDGAGDPEQTTAAPSSVSPTPDPAPASAPATPSPAADTATPTWKVRRHAHADLDLDGVKEYIGMGGESGPVRIRTTLSGSGTELAFEARYGGAFWWPEGYPDLDHDGLREIVLSLDAGDQQALVITIRDGELVPIRPPSNESLSYGPTAGAEPGTAYANDWFVRAGRLVSYHSLEAFPLSSHFFDVPDEYRVWVWVWSLQGDWLRQLDQGVWCHRSPSQFPVPCDQGDLPDLLPAVDATEPVDAFPADLPPSECGPYGGVSPIPIPGGPDGASGRLVRGPGCAESQSFEVYVEVDGRWVAAEHPPRPFLGDGIEEVRRGHATYDTWVTATGAIFSSRTLVGSARRQVWRWTLDGTELRDEFLGRVCFEPAVHPRTYGTC